MRKRKSYGAEVKAKIALEAIKGQRTVQEIASHYEVHPSQVTQWKRHVKENLPEDRRKYAAFNVLGRKAGPC